MRYRLVRKPDKEGKLRWHPEMRPVWFPIYLTLNSVGFEAQASAQKIIDMDHSERMRKQREKAYVAERKRVFKRVVLSYAVGQQQDLWP